MSNTIDIKIDEDIVLPDSLSNMPDNLKGHLRATLTFYANKYKCHWTNLDWSVKMTDGQPVINVKKKL